MTKEQLKEYLDHKFRQLFKDRTQTSFMLDEDLQVRMVRKKTLKTSYIEVWSGDLFVDRERLGRFSNYNYFLDNMTERFIYYLEYKYKIKK